jgi:hypothetical protein
LNVAKAMIAARSPLGQTMLNAHYLPPGPSTLLRLPFSSLPVTPIVSVYNPVLPPQSGQ